MSTFERTFDQECREVLMGLIVQMSYIVDSYLGGLYRSEYDLSAVSDELNALVSFRYPAHRILEISCHFLSGNALFSINLDDVRDIFLNIDNTKARTCQDLWSLLHALSNEEYALLKGPLEAVAAKLARNSATRLAQNLDWRRIDTLIEGDDGIHNRCEIRVSNLEYVIYDLKPYRKKHFQLRCMKYTSYRGKKEYLWELNILRNGTYKIDVHIFDPVLLFLTLNKGLHLYGEPESRVYQPQR